MTMKSLLKNLLALGVALGVVAGASFPVSAETVKKKTDTGKKLAGKTASNNARKVTANQLAVKKPVSTGKELSGKPAAKTSAKKVAQRGPGAQEDGSGSIDQVKSASVAVFDQTTGDLLFEKNASAAVPIASITKLMTAMVALDALPNLAESITITAADLDTLKGTRSRLTVGAQLSREEMMLLMLMSSENRAASALSRHYPGGREAFVEAMNTKAKMLGLTETNFSDPTGLSPANVASARDLVKLVNAAHQYPLIREFSTSEEYKVSVRGRLQTFRNTNALVRNDKWSIGLSKTGYISEAGKCLVMQAWLDNKPTIIVLLDSLGQLTRIGDANRIKRWVESHASRGGTIRS
jgi:D-alanyl-D-alanine endopeptidase (penicillin-binding protein 7)